MTESRNEIVVYHPDTALRLDVRLENETVWLTQEQMVCLFGRDQSVIARHINNIFKEGELVRDSVYAKFAYTANDGKIYQVAYYNLDVVISVGYRVKSVQGTRFRQWAMHVLKDYLLRGYAFNQRLNQLEDKFDRRLLQTEHDVAKLKDKVDFFVQTQTPPLQGVFYEGQLWDACSFVEKLIARAKSSILLIDNWIDTGTLDMLAKKCSGVTVNIITSARGNNLAASDIDKFNEQYPALTIKTSKAFHDRFLIIDEEICYSLGASLNRMGTKVFIIIRINTKKIINQILDLLRDIDKIECSKL